MMAIAEGPNRPRSFLKPDDVAIAKARILYLQKLAKEKPEESKQPEPTEKTEKINDPKQTDIDAGKARVEGIEKINQNITEDVTLKLEMLNKSAIKQYKKYGYGPEDEDIDKNKFSGNLKQIFQDARIPSRDYDKSIESISAEELRKTNSYRKYVDLVTEKIKPILVDSAKIEISLGNIRNELELKPYDQETKDKIFEQARLFLPDLVSKEKGIVLPEYAKKIIASIQRRGGKPDKGTEYINAPIEKKLTPEDIKIIVDKKQKEFIDKKMEEYKEYSKKLLELDNLVRDYSKGDDKTTENDIKKYVINNLFTDKNFMKNDITDTLEKYNVDIKI